METTVDHLEDIKSKMKAEQLPDLAIRSFAYYYKQLVDGATGLIHEHEIVPVTKLPELDQLDPSYEGKGASVLGQVVVLKLNGGLGTSMGLQRAKSLLPVKKSLTFLDVIAQQALHWDVPLVLMNSFSTAKDSREHLRSYPDLYRSFPIDFLQHKVPKITQHELAPAVWKKDPSLEWCPPGHGDIYTALLTTGMLDRLLKDGIKYAFVSNSDNLGAKLDLSLLGYFSSEKLPFMMEVADRTLSDRKGGHLAQWKRGGFVLRESAQCPESDSDIFQDINTHPYFNTNNLWLQLEVLKEVLEEKRGILGLPMIRNRKTVDPRDAKSAPVYQLETAMGAAIGIFNESGAIKVPRSRFAPVKTTNQLLAVQSDAYALMEDYSIALDESRDHVPCTVQLDQEFYKTVDQISYRFPYGPPSMKACESLTVHGDVHWGRDIVCEGTVVVHGGTAEQVHVADGTHLSGEVTLK